MEIIGATFIFIGLCIAVIGKFVIFKPLEGQIKNINYQYDNMSSVEDAKEDTHDTEPHHVNNEEDNKDFLQILKIVKFVMYILSSAVVIFGILIILIFRIYT